MQYCQKISKTCLKKLMFLFFIFLPFVTSDMVLIYIMVTWFEELSSNENFRIRWFLVWYLMEIRSLLLSVSHPHPTQKRKKDEKSTLTYIHREAWQVISFLSLTKMVTFTRLPSLSFCKNYIIIIRFYLLQVAP